MIWRGAFSFVSPGGRGGRLSVLIFHRVSAVPDPLFPGEPYAEQFDHLVEHIVSRFQVIGLTDAVNGLIQGTLPPRALAITFDDGYADNLSVAAPILMRYRVPAMIFIATGYIDGGCMWNDLVIEAFRKTPHSDLDLQLIGLGRHHLRSFAERRAGINRVISEIKYLPPRRRREHAEAILSIAEVAAPNDLMLTRVNVRELHASGFEVGSHTVTHPILARLDPEAAWREISGGKDELEEMVGKAVTLFAYPNGRPNEDFSAEHVRMVREAGFTAAFTTAAGTSGAASDIYQLPRFTPWSRDPLRFDLMMLRNLWQHADLHVA